jgi:hypothetical protein
VNPDKPFILRVDASGRAVGAALEQFAEDTAEKPDPTTAMTKKTVPVAFCSRKLTPGQVRSWSPREKETYAVILALQKWASWIGMQPVLVLTDHKSIEAWATEALDTPSGPAGRRARWHELLSRFDITVAYVPGKDNTVADALSRWAYPASQAFADVSIHGSEEDDRLMKEIIKQEEKEQKTCMVINVADLTQAQKQLQEPVTVAVTTRGGAKTGEDSPTVPGSTENGDTPQKNSKTPQKPAKTTKKWVVKETIVVEPSKKLAEATPRETTDEAGNMIQPDQPKNKTPENSNTAE